MNLDNSACVIFQSKDVTNSGITGDIGYQPEQVERKLEDLFTLANRWGCVLLLDEADVFLAKRKVTSKIFSKGLVPQLT